MEDQRLKNIDALSKLANFLSDLDQEEIKEVIQKAYQANAWFTPENVVHTLGSIRDQLMDQDSLSEWLLKYPLAKVPRNIGLILAGNIPAVGWNDVLCTFLSGHHAKIKYSEKDNILIPFLIQKLISFDPHLSRRFEAVERLKEFDAVIATGSNNTSKYFEQYFGHKPNIIRKNRNGVAVLDGSESTEDLVKLGKDFFTYFGLGCRNVSKMYVPNGFDFNIFLETIHDHYKSMAMHNKYANNIDYNIALYLLNKVKYQNNGCVIIIEDPRFISRIASLHYEYYDSLSTLTNHLNEHLDNIQCIVSKKELTGLKTFSFGEAQHPRINEFADGIDTMDFLAKI